MNLATGVNVRAVKVILYTEKGDKLIYKLGDPDGHKDLLVTIEKMTDYDEAYLDSYTPVQFITGSRIKLTIET